MPISSLLDRAYLRPPGCKSSSFPLQIYFWGTWACGGGVVCVWEEGCWEVCREVLLNYLSLFSIKHTVLLSVCTTVTD